tara:strand:- start:174 stop:509 length:336 start_codon:yes stop_codon:yes gene_type:complete
MKKIKLLIFALLFTFSFSGISNPFSVDYENPNGEPFLISIGIEKNIDSFKYYNQSSFYITAPINKMMTFKYRENVTYSEDMIILKSEHDKIQHLDKHYSLELHLPVFALFR